MKGTTDSSDVAKAEAEERRLNAGLTYNDRVDADFARQMADLVCQEADDAISGRSDWERERALIVEVYEGEKREKKDPWVGCSNVRTGLLFSRVETLHANLFPLVYNPNWARWVALDAGSRLNLDNVRRLMAWGQKDVGFVSVVDDSLHDLILCGTDVLKIGWQVEYRHIRRMVPAYQKIAKRLQKTLAEIVKGILKVDIKRGDYEPQFDYVRFERGVVEQPPIDDVLFPNVAVSGPNAEDKLPYIIHRTRPTLNDVAAKQRQGFYMNSEGLRAALADLKNAPPTTQHQPQEQGRIQETVQRMEGTQQQPMSTDYATCTVLERYGKVNVPGIGYEECVVWVERATKTFLGIMPLKSARRDGRRPWAIGQLIRRECRVLGETPARQGADIQEIADTVFNQQIDAATISIAPPGFYRAASGYSADIMKIRPGVQVPVDDPQTDVKWLQLGNSIFQTGQNVKLLFEMEDQVMGSGPLQMGQESPTNRSRSTARGTLAILARGDVRTSSVGTRIRQFYARALELLHQTYADHMPDSMASRLVDEDGLPIFPEGASNEDFVGNFGVVLDVDPAGGDKEAELANLSTAYQAILANPVLIQNVPLVMEASVRFIKGTGWVDVEKYIGPRPQPQQISVGASVQDEIHAILGGVLPTTRAGANPVEILMGLSQFAETDAAKEMEPEKLALLRVRLLVLKAESARQVVQTAEEQERLEAQGGQPATLGLGVGGAGGAPQLPGMEGPPGAGPEGAPEEGGGPPGVPPQAGLPGGA